MYVFAPRDEMAFNDRRSAGKELAAALIKRGSKFAAILGLTRGGVPLAFEIAVAMNAPMDVLVIKKLRTPGNPELAIGAVSSEGAKVLREDIMRQLGVRESYLQQEIRERVAEALEDEHKYRGNNPPLDIRGASVAVVDDGIATGASVEAAVASARLKGASSVTVATPVGSREACTALRSVADDVFCLSMPAEFWAVGMFYRDFSQMRDEEVRQLLDQSRAALKKAGTTYSKEQQQD